MSSAENFTQYVKCEWFFLKNVNGGNLHEPSKPILSEQYFKLLSAEIITQPRILNFSDWFFTVQKVLLITPDSSGYADMRGYQEIFLLFVHET